jgi:hypothetical protein
LAYRACSLSLEENAMNHKLGKHEQMPLNVQYATSRIDYTYPSFD